MATKAHHVDSVETRARKDQNNFMMDFENYALRSYAKKHPTGVARYIVKDWKKHMKAAMEDSDTTWDAYVLWVKNGGGDEWFQDDPNMES